MIDLDRWYWLRGEWLSYYPPQRGKFRGDFQLIGPELFLRDIRTDHNPHWRHGLEPHRCYYASDEWSTIFEPLGNGERCRILVESNNPDPVRGERVVLYSTSSVLWNEPWGRNRANKFVFYRNRFWRVEYDEFLHRWRGNLNYPLMLRWRSSEEMQKYASPPDSYSASDFLPPTYLEERVVPPIHGLLEAILEMPADRDNYLILADYLAEQECTFHEYIREAVSEHGQLTSPDRKHPLYEILLDAWNTRTPSVRTCVFVILNLLQLLG